MTGHPEHIDLSWLALDIVGPIALVAVAVVGLLVLAWLITNWRDL